MNKVIFKNIRIITEQRILDDHAVIVKDGVISSIVTQDELGDFFCSDAQVVDGKGMFLSPGFVDIHTHGAGGFDFMDGTPEAFIGSACTHAAYGTTTLLPTSLTASMYELQGFLDAFHCAKSTDYKGADIPGVHLEGPFVSPEFCGAQDPANIKNPSPDIYEKIYEYSKGSIIRWTFAPELPGAAGLMEFLRKNNIYGSIGHSSATYEQVLEAYEQGVSTLTHLYSSMSTISRNKGTRIPGVVESVYLIDGMCAELIADGCHLPASLLELVYKSKDADRLALVTDSMRAAGMPKGKSTLGSLKNGLSVDVHDGVAYLLNGEGFAGSVCTTDRLVRTMIQQVGVSINDAVKMASLTPAKLVGLDSTKGSIVNGKDADLVLFDENITIHLTMVKGEVVYKRK